MIKIYFNFNNSINFYSNVTEQKCLSCKSSYPLLYQGNCLTDCPNKTYKDKNDTICIACNSTCEKCDKNGCTSCSTGYYLNPLIKIVILFSY